MNATRTTETPLVKSINVRFQPSTMRSVLAHPGLHPGQDPNDDGRPVIEITGIPEDVSITDAIRLWDETADFTWLGKCPGKGRHSFRFSELAPGRIIWE